MTHSFSQKTLILRNSHTNSVCFIGHRRITVTNALRAKVTATVKQLIAAGVTVFNFGSHSQFDELCYTVVTAQQQLYPQIRRVHYCLPYENYTTAGCQQFFEQEIDCTTPGTATAGAYVVRNQVMIDDSDHCIFYYDPGYLPPRRRRNRHALTTYQPRSGTAAAYPYAQKRRKVIINLAE